MIILDKPYVSPLLEETIVRNKIPVLINPNLSIALKREMNCLEEKEFFTMYKQSKGLLYTNSENAVSKVYENLDGIKMAEITKVLKDKYQFRQKTRLIYPDFHFRKVKRTDLISIDPQSLNFPLILKPAVGFFSMGVYPVNNIEQWHDAVADINSKLEELRTIYPEHVISSEDFLLEQCIEGEEFAVDAYFNQQGQAVILNILKHLFVDDTDTSDRIYFTAKEIMGQWYEPFRKELNRIGEIFDLQHYPVHMEFRVQEDGIIIPIELNPLRFAGWCTTDLAYYAYDINPYEYFLFQKEPDWEKILSGKDGTYYCINIADIPESVNHQPIKGINYDKFLTLFTNVLDFRKIDYEQYPVFAFVFSASSDYEEMLGFLNADLTKYLLF